MKYLFTITLMLCTYVAATVHAEPNDYQINNNNPQLLIVEMQTGSTNSAGEEFVEIANNTNEQVKLDGWKLEYKSKTGLSWTVKAELSGTIIPYGRILIASYDTTGGEYLDFSGGFSGTGGHVRIIDSQQENEDILGWGGADSAEALAVGPPNQGNSLKRLVDEDGYFIDTDNNFADFSESDAPSPHMDQTVEDLVAEEIVADQPDDELNQEMDPVEDADSNDTETEGEILTPELLGPETTTLAITELVPDPVKPLTDADDEMIELYNYGSAAAALDGYKIESGASWQYDYVIPELTIQPGEYFQSSPSIPA